MIDLNPSDQFTLHVKIDRFLLPDPRSLIRRQSESLQLLDGTVEEVLVDGERTTCNDSRQFGFERLSENELTWYFDDGSESTCIGILEVVREQRRIDRSRPAKSTSILRQRKRMRNGANMRMTRISAFPAFLLSCNNLLNTKSNKSVSTSRS